MRELKKCITACKADIHCGVVIPGVIMLFSGFSFILFLLADHGKLFLIKTIRWRERFEMRYHVLYFKELWRVLT
jgi:hypothetical protein